MTSGKVSTKGQIVIPTEIRKKHDIKPGVEVDVCRYSLGDWRKLCNENREFTGQVRSSHVLVYGAEI